VLAEEAPMRDFQELKVWQKGHALALSVYRVSSGFPTEERFGLTSQIRRSSVSVPSNIAEGCGRDTDGDLYRFLSIAMGSASELEYQLILARDLEYLAVKDYGSLSLQVTEVKRMLSAFIGKLKADLEK
jgi:four helix bundle protein